MAQRIERNPQDIEALIILLVSRSDATEEDIMALPLSGLEAIIAQLAESLNVMSVVAALSATWNMPDGEA